MSATILVYHATMLAHISEIERSGFLDTPGNRNRRAGVFVADIPLDACDIAGPIREAWFQITVPTSILARFEYQPGENDWQVWLVPAQILNGYSRRLLRQEEVDALRDPLIAEALTSLTELRGLKSDYAKLDPQSKLAADTRRLIKSELGTVRRQRKLVEATLRRDPGAFQLRRHETLLLLIEQELESIELVAAH